VQSSFYFNKFVNMAAAAAAPVEAEARGVSRAWCFTWNNPTHRILFPDGLPANTKYLVYQVERGEQGTEHLQGYIAFDKPFRLSGVRKLEFKTAERASVFPFQSAHLAKAKGNAVQNKAYCTKPEGRVAGPWELGEAPKQGDRTDLKEAAEELMRSGDIRAIDPAVFLKYASGCLKLAALAPPPRRDNLKVITIVGPTGIGKSYSVHDLYPDVYCVNMGNSGLWWDGYTGQPAVMFEEFKGQVQLQKMLQILDPYPLRLEIKGGLVPARFTIVFITSNYTPDKWYKNEDGFRDAEMAALARRLDIGDATRIPARPDGVRYIKVDSRDELHQRIDLAMQIADLTPKPAHRILGPAAAAAAPLADDIPIRAVACPMRAALTEPWDDSTPPYLARGHVPEDDEPPRLRRHNARIIVDDAPDDADMVMVDGEPYVRDDIAAPHP